MAEAKVRWVFSTIAMYISDNSFLLGASQQGIELHCRVLLRIVYGNAYARVLSLQLPCTFPTIHFIGRVTIRNRINRSSFFTSGTERK